MHWLEILEAGTEGNWLMAQIETNKKNCILSFKRFSVGRQNFRIKKSKIPRKKIGLSSQREPSNAWLAMCQNYFWTYP